MLHAKFIITWPDGQRAIAEIEAESPEENFPVQYVGAYGRLVIADPPAQSDVALLRFVMKDAAEKTGGTLSEELAGEYDRQCGGAEGL